MTGSLIHRERLVQGRRPWTYWLRVAIAGMVSIQLATTVYYLFAAHRRLKARGVQPWRWPGLRLLGASGRLGPLPAEPPQLKPPD